MAIIPAVAAALYIRHIYNRPNATQQEVNDPSGDKDCTLVEKRTPAGGGRKWIPFNGGFRRNTPKCALCPEKSVTVGLHRIGNNECIGGSDSEVTTRRTRTKQAGCDMGMSMKGRGKNKRGKRSKKRNS